MNSRNLQSDPRGARARSVLECGGKRSATSLSEERRTDEKRRRRCALPAHSKTWRSIVASLVFLATALAASAQTYAIDWFKIAGGGGASTGGVYSLNGILGQHDAGGPMTSGPYSLVGGFWVLPMLVQSPGTPTLYITNAAPGFATIWWTPPTPGFTLQSTDSLSPTNWVNAPSGTNNPAAVPATLPARFFRLFKP